MKIDWHAQTTDILLNPRIEISKRERYKELLLSLGNFPGHLWFTTSGTTGRFKFVALSKEAMLSSAMAVNDHFECSSNDTWINVLPTFHVGGVGIFARSYLSGAKILNLYSENKRWDPQEFINISEKSKATLSALVPTQVHDIVKLQAKAPKSIRAIIVGGGVLDELLYRKAQSLGWNLFPSYGLTECASQVATAVAGEYSRYKILKHVQVKIDTEGYININSSSLLSTYAFIDKGIITCIDPKRDSWFKTEDIGEINGDYLIVLGRKGDFLKIGGESVSLRVVQRNLDKQKIELGIDQDMILFPKDDERLGKVIALCIEGSFSSKLAALIDRYNTMVLPYERIQHITSVDKIPRNDMGKVQLKNIN